MRRPLAGRVARLEARAGRGCRACGGGGAGQVTYEVVAPEAAERVGTDRAADEPDCCPKCGRVRALWVSMPAARAEG